jgi:hypothetical protein
MPTQIFVPERFKLYIPDLDNHVSIENRAGDVVIRATRDNFSGTRKMLFIRHLSAEGYIPDHYQWFTEPSMGGRSGVEWIAPACSDESEAGFPSLRKLCTRRNAIYGCFFVVWLVCFVWAAYTYRGL